eukprot:m.89572 g.89572  ORF g.89572 m.89572 type:complete len:727 (-) comp14585_c2_seq3:187-2367(-)
MSTDPLPRDNRLALHSTQRLLDQARTSKLSTIPHLSDEDVANIWFGISQFIAKAISSGKGVNVPGLGVFALSVIDDRTPIFQLSQQFIQAHNLKADPKPASSNCTIISLNFSDVAQATSHNRQNVESCFHEIMAALSHQIRDPSPRGLALIVFGVGKLSIRDGKVRFAFFNKFLENPHTVDLTDVNQRLSSRPATVGIVEHLEKITRESQTSRSATPRLLCTPTVTSLHLDLGPSSTSQSALEPKLRPQRVHNSKITWQSSMNSDAMVPILDGPISSLYKPSSPLAAEAQRKIRPKPMTEVLEEVENDEFEQYQRMAQRNMQSSLFMPVESAPDNDPIPDKPLQMTSWGVKPPTTHPRDRGSPVIADKKVPSYADWLKIRETAPKTPTRRRMHIRDQLDRDETLQTMKQQAEKEEELWLHSVEKQKADKAAALERKLEEARKEAERKAAEVNKTLMNTKTTKAETDPTVQMEGGADVFVFRPATSKSAIRRRNQDLMQDLLAQDSDRKKQREESAVTRRQAEKQSLNELSHSLKALELQSMLRKQEETSRYKTDLDTQIQFKTETEKAAARVHPRQPVPFDLKHLPGSEDVGRANSAVGRPAAALGPEMYRQHDHLELQMQENARRVYAEQVEAQARKHKEELEATRKAKDIDSRIIQKTLTEYKEDLRQQRQARREMRQDLQSTWEQQDKLKKRKDSDEQEERKLAAPAPIKDQMDYLAFLNGFA